MSFSYISKTMDNESGTETTSRNKMSLRYGSSYELTNHINQVKLKVESQA